MSPLGDASFSYPHAMKARTWQYGNPLVRNLVRTSARLSPSPFYVQTSDGAAQAVDHEGLARNVIKKPFVNAVEIARNHSTEFFFQDAMSVVDGNLQVYYDHRTKKTEIAKQFLIWCRAFLE